MRYSMIAKRLAGPSAAALLILSTSIGVAHADPSLADIAEQIRALRAENAQIRAENRQMKAAISDMKGENRRVREKVRTVVARTPEPYHLPPPGAPSIGGGVPAIVTPDKRLQFGTITITPGGFVAAESAFRSRTEQVDIGSGYQNIPFGPQAGTNEFRFTARQSRIALLAEAPITPTFLASAYGEFDFLGSGVTSNENESNSFAPRIRHLYGTLDANDYGMHVLAGQNWSLATLNSKGITPRNEITPPTIDSQYVPGFVWKRQPQIRLVKDFAKRLWVALSAEEPQNLLVGCTPGQNGTAIPGLGAAGGVNTLVTCQLTGNNNLNNTTNFSIDHVPDVVGKVAYEAKFADRDVHLEAFGLYRNLYDRTAYVNGLAATNPTATNQNRTGYGVGGGLVVPVLPKRLDFQVSGMVGRGIGSYGTAQFSDATFAADGSESPIREQMLLAGLTAHATQSIDLYAFGGVEQVQANYYATNVAGTAFAGYGAPNANNSGCYNVITAGSCAANAKRVWQVTGGMWDKLYKGAFGEVRVGLQYSYTKRELFQGNGTTAPAAALGFAPHQDDQSLLTSFRYYPFQ